MTAAIAAARAPGWNTGREVSDPAGRALIGLALFLCCMPYLVFGPLAAPSQVQPWAALVSWLFVAQRMLTRGLWINNLQILLIGFAFWFMIYVYRPADVSLDYYLRRSAAFLLSAGIVLAMQYLSPATLWAMLRLTLPVWSLVGLLGYASPALYFRLVTPLVPTVIGVSGERGTTSLAPEATDFGFTMAFMLLLCLLARAMLREEGARVERWPVWLALFNVALSKSGSGFFAALTIGLVHYLSGRARSGRGGALKYAGALMAVALLLLVLASMPQTGIRGIDLMLTAVQSPEALFNTTFSYRVLHNVVGLIGMYDSDLRGFGAGAFLVEGPRIYAEYDLGRVFGLTGWYAVHVPLTLSISPIAFFPVIFLEYGLIGLLYVLLLFRGVGLSALPMKAVCLAMLFLTWAQSFPAAYPPFWLLVGLAMNPAFQQARRAVTADAAIQPIARRVQ